MTNADNKRDLFYNLLYAGLTAVGGFNVNEIVKTWDTTTNRSKEIFISIEDDYLVDNPDIENYGSKLEMRGCNFSVLIRAKTPTSKDIMEAARKLMNPILDTAERQIRNINYQNNYQIVVNTVIQYYISINDIQIKTSAYILDEMSEGIIDGTIFYEFSK